MMKYSSEYLFIFFIKSSIKTCERNLIKQDVSFFLIQTHVDFIVEKNDKEREKKDSFRDINLVEIFKELVTFFLRHSREKK